MDMITASQQKLAFVKICVEVEASMEIPHSIEVEMKDGSMISVIVDVPWYPQRCSHCFILVMLINHAQRKQLLPLLRFGFLKKGLLALLH